MRQRIFIALFSAAAIAISQLSVFAQTFLTYRCHDGSEFIVVFYEGDKRAHIQLDGKAIALQGRISLSGSRYTKGDITLRITKTVTTLKRGKRVTDCVAE
jgi:membrane-bound inhibitor of C-type lysozyme